MPPSCFPVRLPTVCVQCVYRRCTVLWENRGRMRRIEASRNPEKKRLKTVIPVLGKERLKTVMSGSGRLEAGSEAGLLFPFHCWSVIPVRVFNVAITVLRIPGFVTHLRISPPTNSGFFTFRTLLIKPSVNPLWFWLLLNGVKRRAVDLRGVWCTFRRG